MKTITMLIIALFAAVGLQAQTEVTPAQVIFNCGGSKVTLKEAKTEGAKLDPNFDLEIVFSKTELEKLQAESVNFEFRWYYYMSTKKTLMSTATVTTDISAADDNLVHIKSEKKNPRKGWWEVQIKCKTNESQIEFAGTKEFSILLK
ncbi:MAG: hypothetical protein IKQ70_05030 [Bacteroidales bacterium]|nr:hypothetical protein [Bacteroidales bacterium]